MHLTACRRAIVVSVWVAGPACGPSVAVPAGNDTSGSSSTSPALDTSIETAEAGDGTRPTMGTEGSADLTSADATTAEPTTTGGSAGWPEPRELLELSSERCSYFGVASLVVAGQYLHVGAFSGTAYSQHWVVDRDSGEVLAILPGASLGVSGGFVYGAGFVDGGVGQADAPFGLYRVAYDGTGFTELLVSDHPLGVVLAFDDAAFVASYLPGRVQELWRADDATTTLEPLGDISDVSTWRWIHDDGEVLLIDAAQDGMSVLDMMDLTLEPLFEFDGTGSSAAANSEHVFVGTNENVIVRATKPAYAASTIATQVPVDDVVADDEVIVWAGDRSIFAAAANGDDPTFMWTDRNPIEHLAMDADAVYFTTSAPDGEPCYNVFAVLARVDRP